MLMMCFKGTPKGEGVECLVLSKSLKFLQWTKRNWDQYGLALVLEPLDEEPHLQLHPERWHRSLLSCWAGLCTYEQPSTKTANITAWCFFSSHTIESSSSAGQLKTS